MHPFRLARIAAEAEGVRLRGRATRFVTSAIFALIALFFVLAAVVFGHVAAWYAVRTALDQSFLTTTGIMGGGDLLLALVLGFLATRSSPSRVEVEALNVREKAIEGITGAVHVTQVLVPLLRILSDLRSRRRA